MKNKILISIGILISLIGGMFALQASKSLTLYWDNLAITDKWTEIRIYDISTTPETLVTTVACSVPGTCPTQATFIVPRAGHEYVARSSDGFWESGDSNAVTIGAPPRPPQNVKK